MKIFQIIPSLDIGGAEKLVTELVLNFDKENNDIYLIILYESKDTIFEKKLRNKNINMIFLDKKLGLDISIIFKLRKLIKKFKPDIINTHLNTLPYIALSTRILRSKPKLFHTFHTIAEKEVLGKLKKIYKYIFKKCKVNIIGISRLVTESIYEEYKPKEVFTIYNGIDYNSYYCEIPTGERKIDFICVGSLIYVKNQELLIDAMKIVVEQFPKSQLFILGKGDLHEKLVEKTNEFGLENNIIFKGAVSNVNEYLSNSKVFLMSSHWEGNPLSLLEASAAGCIIISTKVGGISDVITDGYSGYFEENNPEAFANRMMYVLEHQEEINKTIVKNNQQNIFQYDIKNVCELYEKLYLKFLI